MRLILGSFFRLAALKRDESLLCSSVHLTSVGFWPFDLCDDVGRRQVQLLVAEYLVQVAVSGDVLWG